jgi:hypothetical protein
LTFKRHLRAGGLVECLPHKCEALSSNSTTKKKKSTFDMDGRRREDRRKDLFTLRMAPVPPSHSVESLSSAEEPVSKVHAWRCRSQ